MRTTEHLAAGIAACAMVLPVAAGLALLLAATPGHARAAQPSEGRVIVLLHTPGGQERMDDLRLALEAHLSEDPAELRLVEVARRAGARAPAELDRLAAEHGATALVWLDDDGVEIFVFVPGQEASPRSREVPDYGEGWASRCEAMAMIVASDLRGEGQPAETTERSWLFGIAPRLGLAVPTSALGPAMLAAIEVDFFLPVMERRVVVMLDLALTRPEHQGAGTDARVGGDYEYSMTALEAKLSIGAVYRFLTRERPIVPFVGLGPAVQVVRTTERTSFDASENSERTFEFGAEVLGGADLRVGPGAVYAELRLVLTTLRQRLTGDTNSGYAGLAVGYRFVF